jgi:dTDP-4-amino-4,6-dideoxygalactose transaminase
MIKFLDLQKVTALHAQEYHEAVRGVVDSGWFLQGEQVKAFESEYASYIGTRHCIGVGNGLDALTLIYRAYLQMGLIHEGDEVMVPANTYIASILAISENGLRPVLIEPRWDTLEIDDSLLEQHLTERTRSVMIVHLYGRNAYTDRIGDFCRRHNLLLVEDNAQAHGAMAQLKAGNSQQTDCAPANCQSSIVNYQFKRTGSLGHAAGNSFYPGKNLGAMGDAGAVTTDDDQLADIIRSLGNYGSSRKYVFDYVGRNSRLDEMQAALLRVKLRHLDDDNERRRQIARRYEQGISNPLITLPARTADAENVYHLFPIFTPWRDALQQYLCEHGVETLVHYPIPPHQQRCYGEWHHLSLPITERISREELSLPMSPALGDDEVDEVIRLVNEFKGE